MTSTFDLVYPGRGWHKGDFEVLFLSFTTQDSATSSRAAGDHEFSHVAVEWRGNPADPARLGSRHCHDQVFQEVEEAREKDLLLEDGHF